MATVPLSNDHEEGPVLPVSPEMIGTIPRQPFTEVLTKLDMKRMQRLARGIRDGFVMAIIEGGQVRCIRHAKDYIIEDV